MKTFVPSLDAKLGLGDNGEGGGLLLPTLLLSTSR
jgi:hypothetical protein